MSDIATKLTTIAENQQKVYDAGYDKGVSDGKQAERDAFWRVYMDDGNRDNLDYAFAGEGWTDETFTYPETIIGTSMYNVFRGSGVSYIPSISFENVHDAESAFKACPNLVTIEEIYFSTQFCPDEVNFTEAFNTPNLMNITAFGDIGTSLNFKSCKKLTSSSAFSIVECLCNLATEWDSDWSGEASITFHSDVWDRLNADYPDYEDYGYSDWQEYLCVELGWQA